jgi:hypothetical protein
MRKEGRERERKAERTEGCRDTPPPPAGEKMVASVSSPI